MAYNGKKIALTKYDLYLYWIIISIFLNAFIDTSYVVLCCSLIVNIIISVGIKKEIWHFKTIGRYVLFLIIFYLIVFKNITIIRYSIYIISLYCYICIARFLFDKNANKTVMIIEKISLINAVLSISEMILKTNIYLDFFGIPYSALDTGSSYRVCGLAVHPIINSSFALVAFFISIMGYENKKKTKHLLLAALQLLVIALTKTRSAYLSLVVVFGIIIIKFIITNRKSVSKKAFVSIFSLIVFAVFVIALVPQFRALFYASFVERIFELFSTGSGSYLQRMGSIGFIMNYISNNLLDIKTWLGHGFGNLISYLFNEKIFFVHSGFYAIDNQYVSMIYDLGIVNTIVILFYLVKKYLCSKVCISLLKNMFVSILCMIFFYEFIDKSLCLIFFGIAVALLDIGVNPLVNIKDGKKYDNYKSTI